MEKERGGKEREMHCTISYTDNSLIGRWFTTHIYILETKIYLLSLQYCSMKPPEAAASKLDTFHLKGLRIF